MATLLAQAGNTLYKIDPSTGAATVLTLPTGVTLDTTRRAKMAVLDQWCVMTNTPTRNLAIDPEGTLRLLVPRAPTSPPYTASGGAGNLTGAIKTKYSYVVLGSEGQTYMESPLSPASASLTLASNSLAFTGMGKSLDTITARRLYRTLAGGSVYYQIGDVDGNSGTTAYHNTADAGVELLPADTSDLIAPPGTLANTRLKLLVSWKSRLWGVSSDATKIDEVVYTEQGAVYKWSNTLQAHPKGQEANGIVAFAPRQDQLGVLKRTGVWQIAGDADDEFALVQVQTSLQGTGTGGCIAEDSVCVMKDRAYWLSTDGVWEWSSEGLKNISDGLVDSWFKSDTYFNRSRFPYAFAKYNEARNTYDLHLAVAGSSVEDRWVSFNLSNRKWYGPHKTGAFTPSFAQSGVDSNGLSLCLVGGTDGKIYLANQTTFHDGSATAIDFDCYTPFHYGNAPDIEHYFGELSMLTKIESSGVLTITPTVGRLNSAAGTDISHDLTKGRERLRRLGAGAGVQLRFRQNTADIGTAIFGYEIPGHEIGRR